jgi:hypothetical protein
LRENTTAAIPFSVLPFRAAIDRARPLRRASEYIREAIELYIESLTEDGLPIPVEGLLVKAVEIPV